MKIVITVKVVAAPGEVIRPEGLADYREMMEGARKLDGFGPADNVTLRWIVDGRHEN